MRRKGMLRVDDCFLQLRQNVVKDSSEQLRRDVQNERASCGTW